MLSVCDALQPRLKVCLRGSANVCVFPACVFVYAGLFASKKTSGSLVSPFVR